MFKHEVPTIDGAVSPRARTVVLWKDGKVVSRTVQMGSLEDEVKKLMTEK